MLAEAWGREDGGTDAAEEVEVLDDEVEEVSEDDTDDEMHGSRFSLFERMSELVDILHWSSSDSGHTYTSSASLEGEGGDEGGNEHGRRARGRKGIYGSETEGEAVHGGRRGGGRG